MGMLTNRAVLVFYSLCLNACGGSGGRLFWWVGAGTVLFVAAKLANQPARQSGRREPKPMPYGDAAFLAPEKADAHSITLPAGLRCPPTDIFLGYDEAGCVVRYSGEKSIITIGASGTGKATTTIIPNALHWRGGSFIAFDPKGELASVTAPWRNTVSSVFILNPFDLCAELEYMESAHWNPLDELEPSDFEFATLCQKIAAAIILREGKDPHWANAARSIVTGVIGFVASEPGETRTLPRVYDIIQLPKDSFLAVMMMMAQSDIPFVRHAASTFITSPKSTQESARGSVEDLPRSVWEVLETARAQLSEFMGNTQIRHILSDSDFRFSDMKREPISVYIVLPEKHAKTFSRLTRLIFSAALDAAQSLPKNQSLFVMDELATSLGGEQLEMVETAFNLGRGYGLRIHAFFQNWAQVEEAFGTRAESVVSAAGVKQFFRVADEKTFQRMRDAAGKTTLWYSSVSTSRSNTIGSSPDGRGGERNTHSVSHSWSTSEHAKEQDLITREIAFEKLGAPHAGNKWTALQVLFFEGLAAPLLSSRVDYRMLPFVAVRAAGNPYHGETHLPALHLAAALPDYQWPADPDENNVLACFRHAKRYRGGLVHMRESWRTDVIEAVRDFGEHHGVEVIGFDGRPVRPLRPPEEV